MRTTRQHHDTSRLTHDYRRVGRLEVRPVDAGEGVGRGRIEPFFIVADVIAVVVTVSGGDQVTWNECGGERKKLRWLLMVNILSLRSFMSSSSFPFPHQQQEICQHLS